MLAPFVVAVVLVVLGLVALVAGPALAFRVALGLALFVFVTRDAYVPSATARRP